ncbi:MAG: transcriptional regulator BetI [Woeseia sp.]|jgi:TetR/AcrR family transcriptional regulator, transcriptional repressor of bet genes|nr:transcriptional regulator BetI [Woeseia sp.]
MVAGSATVGRRALAKEQRRQQLIDATIKCIAKKGLSSTTLADVAKEAGLSQGIVNLHFDSKDNLLYETLRYVSEDYDKQFMATYAQTSADPAACLLALIKMDLQPSICDAKKLAVWFAFWSEVKAVPTYQKLCAARERKYDDVLVDLAARIIDDGGYEDADASLVAKALGSLTDGLWLSCLVDPKSFDRQVALNTVKSYLRGIFPDHYLREPTA